MAKNKKKDSLRRRNPITIRQRFRHLFVRLQRSIVNNQLPPLDIGSYLVVEHGEDNIMVDSSIYPVLTPDGEVIGMINSRNSQDLMVSDSVLDLNSNLPL